MKRIISILLILILLVGIMPSALATSYYFDLYTWALIGYEGPGGEVIVPEEASGVGEEAFENNDEITSVIIPEGVTFIGDWAFSGCSNLKNVSIPSTVTSIGRGAFAFCTSLETIAIPDSVTFIDEYAFQDCYALSSISLPDSLVELPFGMFENCTALTSVKLPKHLKTIPGSIFENCLSLTDITFPDKLEVVGDEAFLNCISLAKVVLPESVILIDEMAFKDCAALKSVTIPNGLKVIGDGAFENCDLRSLTIPDSVETIGRSAFNWNAYLPEVIIGSGIKKIDAYAFNLCGQLSKVTIKAKDVSIHRRAFAYTEWMFNQRQKGDYVIVDGSLMEYCGAASVTVVPDNATRICEDAFSEREVVEEVTVPGSVKIIEWGAFKDCLNLTSVTLLDGVKTIDEAVFMGCPKLSSVTIPASVTSIGYNAFYGSKDVTIACYKGSYAEAFAKENGYSYVTISESLMKFSDVKPGDYFAETVAWAIENAITDGTSDSTFSPKQTCTNAQILTFMWRANGSPMPKAANPFSNINGNEYYANAAAWAYENGMISGDMFDANKLCTRAMTVEYLWKQAGSPATKVYGGFSDVDAGDSWAQAVAWAVNNGVTDGTSETTFSPADTCTRAQIVTFLYRVMN